MKKMNNKNGSKATWSSILDLVVDLKNINSTIVIHKDNFLKASNDEELLEKDRSTLSKLSGQLSDINNSNISTISVVEGIVASMSKGVVSNDDFEEYLMTLRMLDERINLSVTYIENVLDRMFANVETAVKELEGTKDDK